MQGCDAFVLLVCIVTPGDSMARVVTPEVEDAVLSNRYFGQMHINQPVCVTQYVFPPALFQCLVFWGFEKLWCYDYVFRVLTN